MRKIAAHDPDTLPIHEYMRQIFWSSGIDLPDDFERLLDEIVLDAVDLPPGERAILSLQLPAEFVIVFEPVTHAAQFIDVKGEPTRERQSLSLVLNESHVQLFGRVFWVGEAAGGQDHVGGRHSCRVAVAKQR